MRTHWELPRRHWQARRSQNLSITAQILEMVLRQYGRAFPIELVLKWSISVGFLSQWLPWNPHFQTLSNYFVLAFGSGTKTRKGLQPPVSLLHEFLLFHYQIRAWLCAIRHTGMSFGQRNSALCLCHTFHIIIKKQVRFYYQYLLWGKYSKVGNVGKQYIPKGKYLHWIKFKMCRLILWKLD